MQLIHYPLSKDQQIAGEQKTIVVLDCLLLAVHSVKIPKMRASQAKSAVAYALEDGLLQALDEVAVFPQKENGDTWEAIVVAREVLAQVSDKISENAINCLALVPEFMLLPVIKGKIAYFEQQDWVLFRASKFNGGKLDKTLFFELYQTDVLQASTLGEYYADFNFFKVNLWEKYGKQVKQFRASMALTACIFALSLVGLALENQQLSKRLELKIMHNKTLFQSTFPSITRIIDLPVQLNDRLAKINQSKILLNSDLLSAMSRYSFGKNTKNIKFDNNKLTALK